MAPRGQTSVAWFSIAALLGIALLWRVGAWYARVGANHPTIARRAQTGAELPSRTVVRGLAVLLVLVFSKFVYLTSLTNYYAFFLIHRFHVSVASAQIHLFDFSVRSRPARSSAGPSAIGSAAST